MPRITAQTVDQVARLARLSLTDEERQAFARQLEEILAYAEAIQALDTASVDAMSQIATDAPLREDVSLPGLSRGDALAPAPDAKDGLFRVPRVLAG